MIIVGFFAGIICAFFIAKWAKKEWIKKGHGTAVSTLGSVSLGICTFIMFLVASIVMSSKSDVSDQAQQTSVVSAPQTNAENNIQKIAEQPIQENIPSLNMTAEEFRKNLNAQLKKANVSYLRPIAEFDIEQGKTRDSFQVTLTKEIGIMGTINKNGEMFGITLIMANSDETGKPAVDMLLLSSMVALAVNPELDGSEAGEMIIDLTKKAVDGIDQPDNSHTKTIGSNRYFSIASRQIGLWIGVEPALAKAEE